MTNLKGAPVAAAIFTELKDRISGFSARPRLLAVRFGDEPDALSYARGLMKRFEKAGLQAEDRVFPKDVPPEEFYKAFTAMNAEEDVCGILVIAPVPDSISGDRLREILDPSKDVDGITLKNRALLYNGEACMSSCCAQAVVEMLRFYGVSPEGKRVVIVGRSERVGKPLFHLLLRENATPTLCHKRTADLSSVTREADILISCAGVPGLITKEHVKAGAVVIDVGINADQDGKLVGDVDFPGVSEKASALSPVPGGVGSVTTAVLLREVVRAYERKHENGNPD